MADAILGVGHKVICPQREGVLPNLPDLLGRQHQHGDFVFATYSIFHASIRLTGADRRHADEDTFHVLELTVEQATALAGIDARNFVDSVRSDLIGESPRLAVDQTLSTRLWSAFRAARALGIDRDSNLVAFLRIEAHSPGFYENPAIRNWLSRPGRPADERFEDYICILRWRLKNPEFVGGVTNGGIGDNGIGSSGGGGRSSLGKSWRRLIGRRSSGGNGESLG